MKEKDSGIVSFEVSQDSWEPNVFHFWERYESNSHMGKHNTCPEMTKFLEDVSSPSGILARTAPRPYIK